ncbi:tetraspanin-19 isoform X1 [Elaeis guineensis]|uniref:tetraspanin-19 isoform X1 n=1 Tax=Elaeis guineensis var. tenera TaxID=51953 RepID=UPI003C6CD966
MGRMARSFLQSLLKLVNSVIGLVGMGMILYSFWMLRVWFRQVGTFWAAGPGSTPPWFIYTFLGLGVTFCLITCSGHVAAETANGHCLSCYMVLVFLLVMLEAAVTADVYLNRDWQEDFPEDPTGRLNDFKNFVRRNFEMCKGIGLVIVAAQASSIFLAMMLRALGPDCGSYYDSDDDYVPARLPLLKNHVQHTPYVADPHVSSRNDSWNVSILK